MSQPGRSSRAAVYQYSNGVMVDHLPAPDDDVPLEPDWALQDPVDYLRTIQETVPSLLRQTGVEPSDVIGIGIDVTACTMLPTTSDGTPLSELPEFRRNPHAWVKLWKHHAAQPQANRINALAEERGEAWLPRYGGKISSEWFFSKSLQILEEAPELYQAADRLIEATDWIVWRLTGVETRNSCTAGYKAIWTKGEGFPSPQFFGALHPGFSEIVTEKMSTDVVSIGERAGGPDSGGGAVDRLVGGHCGGGGERGCPCLGSGVDGHRARSAGGGDGHQHLPHGPRAEDCDRRRNVRGGRGRGHRRSVRIRGRPAGRR